MTSTVESVHIFFNGGFIERTGIVSLNPSLKRVYVTNLPRDLVDTTLILSMEAKNTEIHNIQITETYLNPVQNRRIQTLKEQLHEVQKKIHSLENEIKTREILIDTITKFPLPGNLAGSIREIDKILNYRQEKILNHYSMISSLRMQLEPLYQEKRKIEEEIELISKEKHLTKTIIIDVNVKQPEKVKFLIRYFTGEVYWKPVYSIRIDSVTGKAILDFQAEVQQHTGEDWKDIALHITTHRLYFDSSLPSLSPWYIDLENERVRKEIFSGKSRGVFSSVENFAEHQESKEYNPVQDGISYTFPLQGKYTLISGKKQLLKLSSKDSPASISYFAIPKIQPQVFSTVRIENPYNFPLLQGDVILFVDGNFKNKATLPSSILPGETVQLPLGIEDAIRVERKLEKNFQETGGIFKKHRQITVAYRFLIENTKNQSVVLELQDQIPVSKQESLQVVMEEPETLAPSDGILKWNIPLQPREKKEFFLKYTIRYPEGNILKGWYH